MFAVNVSRMLSRTGMVLRDRLSSIWRCCTSFASVNRAGVETDDRLADVADRFELERRERDSNRWHSDDGSLLGR